MSGEMNQLMEAQKELLKRVADRQHEILKTVEGGNRPLLKNPFSSSRPGLVLSKKGSEVGETRSPVQVLRN